MSSDIHMRTISQEIPELSITKISLKNNYLKFNSNLLGADELIDDTDLSLLWPTFADEWSGSDT